MLEKKTKLNNGVCLVPVLSPTTCHGLPEILRSWLLTYELLHYENTTGDGTSSVRSSPCLKEPWLQDLLCMHAAFYGRLFFSSAFTQCTQQNSSKAVELPCWIRQCLLMKAVCVTLAEVVGSIQLFGDATFKEAVFLTLNMFLIIHSCWFESFKFVWLCSWCC